MLAERSTFEPESPYAISKLFAYNVVRLYRRAYGLWMANAISFNHESERRGELFVTRKITLAVARIANGI